MFGQKDVVAAIGYKRDGQTVVESWKIHFWDNTRRKCKKNLVSKSDLVLLPHPCRETFLVQKR